jgi:hypothetical protein
MSPAAIIPHHFLQPTQPTRALSRGSRQREGQEQAPAIRHADLPVWDTMPGRRGGSMARSWSVSDLHVDTLANQGTQGDAMPPKGSGRRDHREAPLIDRGDPGGLKGGQCEQRHAEGPVDTA